MPGTHSPQQCVGWEWGEVEDSNIITLSRATLLITMLEQVFHCDIFHAGDILLIMGDPALNLGSRCEGSSDPYFPAIMGIPKEHLSYSNGLGYIM
jgi:hypothetical protein